MRLGLLFESKSVNICFNKKINLFGMHACIPRSYILEVTACSNGSFFCFIAKVYEMLIFISSSLFGHQNYVKILEFLQN